MIHESQAYMEELGRIYTRMHKRSTQKRWPDSAIFLLEKDTFIAFFIIRKLIESGTKISTVLSSKQIPLTKYVPTGKIPTRLNNHKLEMLYDLRTQNEITKDIGFICDQMVHSYRTSKSRNTRGEKIASAVSASCSLLKL